MKSIIYLLVVLSLALAGCSAGGPSTIDLMPAPDIYAQAGLNPFGDEVPDPVIYYATNRAPAEEGVQAYSGKRGGVLRLGTATIKLTKGELEWEEARRVSLLKNRSDKYPLQVDTVTELGVLGSSLDPLFTDPALIAGVDDTGKEFAQGINDRLAQSKRKDVFIYVHGYKVDFDNPILVASELWHFLGYEGVFLAYSWPSTPRTMAYLGDLETAELSSYYLRDFLEYLSESTDAERIHIIGYSAGTRVVEKALFQLALINKRTSEEALKKLRIGHAMLIGSDMDARIFGANIQDGLLDVPDDLTVYISENDKAVDFAGWLFDRARLGQVQEELNDSVKEFLVRNPKLRLIDVTGAEAADSGNGHGYFRESPWVSSDILMTLMYDLHPKERGLVKELGWPIWTFPPNYVEALSQDLEKRLAPQ